MNFRRRCPLAWRIQSHDSQFQTGILLMRSVDALRDTGTGLADCVKLPAQSGQWICSPTALATFGTTAFPNWRYAACLTRQSCCHRESINRATRGASNAGDSCCAAGSESPNRLCNIVRLGPASLPRDQRYRTESVALLTMALCIFLQVVPQMLGQSVLAVRRGSRISRTSATVWMEGAGVNSGLSRRPSGRSKRCKFSRDAEEPNPLHR